MTDIEQYIGNANHAGTVYEVYLRGDTLQLTKAGQTGTLYYGKLAQKNYNLPPGLYFPVRDLLENKHIVRRANI